MTFVPHLRRVLKVGLVATAFVFANGQAPAPPLPAAPPIALAEPLLREAAAYQAYVAAASAISASFRSGPEVAASLKTGESFDPQQLLRGEIAYAAVVALQDPEFVASVRAYAADQATRLQIRDALYKDPAYVVTLKGSDAAAGLVTATLMHQGRKLAAAGAAVSQAAFDVQHQAWSKEEVVDRPQRLLDAEGFSPDAAPASDDDVGRLRQATDGTAPLMVLAPPSAPPYSPAVIRGLALAALAALGEAGDENASYVAGFQVDPASSGCLAEAKRNLYECLAVAKPHYEDIFCLGQHAMSETAQCLMVAAGAPPVVTAPAPMSKTAVAYGAKAAPAHRSKRTHRKS
jgi:hypothetical protein